MTKIPTQQGDALPLCDGEKKRLPPGGAEAKILAAKRKIRRRSEKPKILTVSRPNNVNNNKDG